MHAAAVRLAVVVRRTHEPIIAALLGPDAGLGRSVAAVEGTRVAVVAIEVTVASLRALTRTILRNQPEIALRLCCVKVAHIQGAPVTVIAVVVRLARAVQVRVPADARAVDQRCVTDVQAHAEVRVAGIDRARVVVVTGCRLKRCGDTRDARLAVRHETELTSAGRGVTRSELAHLESVLTVRVAHAWLAPGDGLEVAVAVLTANPGRTRVTVVTLRISSARGAAGNRCVGAVPSRAGVRRTRVEVVAVGHRLHALTTVATHRRARGNRDGGRTVRVLLARTDTGRVYLVVTATRLGVADVERAGIAVVTRRSWPRLVDDRRCENVTATLETRVVPASVTRRAIFIDGASEEAIIGSVERTAKALYARPDVLLARDVSGAYDWLVLAVTGRLADVASTTKTIFALGVELAVDRRAVRNRLEEALPEHARVHRAGVVVVAAVGDGASRTVTASTRRKLAASRGDARVVGAAVIVVAVQ